MRFARLVRRTNSEQFVCAGNSEDIWDMNGGSLLLVVSPTKEKHIHAMADSVLRWVILSRSEFMGLSEHDFNDLFTQWPSVRLFVCGLQEMRVWMDPPPKDCD